MALRFYKNIEDTLSDQQGNTEFNYKIPSHSYVNSSLQAENRVIVILNSNLDGGYAIEPSMVHVILAQ